MGEATSLTKIHLKKSKCCKCATWPIQWLFKYKLLHFYLKAKNIWQMSDWNRKRVPNVRILVENCKLLEICNTQMHSHALFLTVIRSFNTWFNKKVTQIHTHQLELPRPNIKFSQLIWRKFIPALRKNYQIEPNLKNESKFDYV